MLSAMPAFVDAWLMEMFPGRTPEELDDMDILRLLRALQVKKIMAAERKAELFNARKLEAKDISTEEWAILKVNDRLVDRG